MAMAQSVDDVLKLPQRKLVVAKNDIDLSGNDNQNDIFILMVQESPGSAGGRAGPPPGRRERTRVHGGHPEGSAIVGDRAGGDDVPQRSDRAVHECGAG